jgi:hypothetical protein
MERAGKTYRQSDKTWEHAGKTCEQVNETRARQRETRKQPETHAERSVPSASYSYRAIKRADRRGSDFRRDPSA